MDMTQHGLENCKMINQSRRTFLLKMKLYNIPPSINLGNKIEVFKEALGNNSYLKALCEFLLVIVKWNGGEATDQGDINY